MDTDDRFDPLRLSVAGPAGRSSGRYAQQLPLQRRTAILRARWVAAAAAGAVVLMGSPIVVMWRALEPMSPIGEPQLVSRAVTTEGQELVVTQSYTGTLEPYVVSLYVRERGASKWAWYYLDHEALYWRGRIVVDRPGSADVYNGRTLIVRWTRGVLEWRTPQAPPVREPQGWLNGDPLDPHAKMQYIAK